MRTLLIILLLAAFATSSDAEDDSPARVLRRASPSYPEKCLPEGPGPYPVETVIIAYDVSKDGVAENVRVRESTNPCFEETAVATVRGAHYAPKRVAGRPVDQEDLEATFIFRFDPSASANGSAQPTTISDFDARPIKRTPPRYPERCMRSARSTEMVYVEFDVNEKGATQNIRVVESTNKCLEGSSIASVAKWEYAPKTVDGVPAKREGVQTLITYELVGSGVPISPQVKVRQRVWYGLTRIRSQLLRNRSPEVVLAELEELEAKYGDEFTPVEQNAFLQIRAGARIRAGDYAGALDDLRLVRDNGVRDPEARKAIEEMIKQLEAALAGSTGQSSPGENDGAEEPKD